MRMELLGLSFTAQHSDARVLDQLLYKWAHSRKVLAEVLTDHCKRISSSGWEFTRQELAAMVNSLLGGAFEQFLSKSQDLARPAMNPKLPP